MNNEDTSLHCTSLILKYLLLTLNCMLLYLINIKKKYMYLQINHAKKNNEFHEPRCTKHRICVKFDDVKILQGGKFDRLDCKKLSADMGTDVTSYNFRFVTYLVKLNIKFDHRKIVTTFILSNNNPDVRAAEEVTMAHSDKVARFHYQQNQVGFKH